MITKGLSYALGLTVALLAIAPPIGYSIPVVINSYSWLYGVIVFGFLGMYLLFTKLPAALKALAVFSFASCFVSQAPYLSFNAYMLVIGAAYCYLGFLGCNYKFILNMVAAVFWLQFILAIMQLCGRDTLMCFGSSETVFLGTVFQYMRFSSLLAIMTPLLILKSKWYLIPVLFLCIVSRSSSFALAVFAGIGVYAFMRFKKQRRYVILGGVLAVIGYAIWDRTSFGVAFTCGRVSVWNAIIRTWLMDTSGPFQLPLAGPIDWKAIFIGRGLDTFLPLFPVFKHDLNPYPQAHNCWLQLLWEIGLIGAGLITVYYFKLMRRLKEDPVLVAGLVCMGVNMFFSFPTRLTQTMLMMICFVAYCEQSARKAEGVSYGR